MRPSSLRTQLLCWLLAPLALAAAMDLWISWRAARETATLVQERMLAGAARVIGGQVHVEDGALQATIPPAALEMFASPSRDRVFYRVSGPGGRLVSGYADLAEPGVAPRPDEVLFFDATQQDRPIHVAAFAQPVFEAPDQSPVLIEVGQTLESRNQLARDIWIGALHHHLGLLLLVALLLAYALRRGLDPLLRLRDRVQRREPGSLEPLPHEAVPAELQPLVAALNGYVARLDAHVSSHSRFIADASHQLRTPLALLNTQVVFALRSTDADARDEALHAIQDSVRYGMRLVQQLLVFTMAEAGPGVCVVPPRADLAATARAVLETLVPLASQRGIDLGLDTIAATATVAAPPQLLHELVANLVHNALRYTQRGGTVTAGVAVDGDQVRLLVRDNGPGIPAAERENVFRRFHRLHDTDSDGSGLGLAIVREIARAFGGRVELHDAPGGGLLVVAMFPLAPPGPVTAPR